MTYREYLNKYPFEKIWRRIKAIYSEAQELKPLYRRLYKSVKALPNCVTSEVITLVYDSRGDVRASNTLDPQEELVDREVETYILEWEEEPIPDEDIPAHLLWWSSMYGFRTAGQMEVGLVEWLDQETGKFQESTIAEIAHSVTSDVEFRAKISDKLIERSIADKRQRYWRSLIDHGSGGYSNFDLDIIHHQIEYKIGYRKYHQYDNWETDVRHMRTACELLDLAAGNYSDFEMPDVNTRNAARFGQKIWKRPKYLYRQSLIFLRRAKAQRLVWQYLDSYMISWKET